MAVDALMRKLKIPSKFVPYMEKHRVYELFYDVGNELAMTQPEDPLLFIKNCLERMDKVRDKRLVVIIAPSNLDRVKLAHIISKKTGYGLLTRYIMCGKSGNHLDPVSLAVNTANQVRGSDKEGWVLVDYPDTTEEAKMLIKHKVIPSHTFLILEDTQHKKGYRPHYVKSRDSVLAACETNMFELKEIFKSSLKVVKLKENTLEDIASQCALLSSRITHRYAPQMFRVALIGPKGSKRKTIAKLLQEKYNLVHVDMFDLINAAKQLDNDLGDEIRYLDKYKLPFSNKLVLDLLKSRIYRKDCLEKGYVLTNYPRSREDFVLLDSLDTPPNKVIFFNIKTDVCKKRLKDRVVNEFTGEIYSSKSINDDVLLKNQTLKHPEDALCVVEEEMKFYEKHEAGLKEYCGGTGHVVDCTSPIKTVLEKVEYVLMSPSPTVRGRSGKPVSRKSSTPGYSSTEHTFSRPYPVSRTQVVPLINSEDLLRRYIQLKHSNQESPFPEQLSKSSKDCIGDVNSQEVIPNFVNLEIERPSKEI